ncbi:uncharacterized protein [Epargyreus clarus]|uniref:uncharacterized protein n=1 Tax=Epargyreus clarus TaxID=520877 RepID=UPI003C2B8C16
MCSALGEDKIILNVSPEQVSYMHNNAKTCGNQYDVDPLFVKKMLDWTVPNNKAVKEFLYCLCVNAGYISKDGRFLIDKMMEIEVLSGSKEEYRKNLEECNEFVGDDHLETTFEMGACVHRKQVFRTQS